jgi:AcrR family transcriptional regulator
MTAPKGTTRQTRNAEHTRAAILAAAGEAMIEHGTGVSLDQVARRARVSKGGLMHHFANKEDLITALVDDSQQRFRNNVFKHLDLAENTPGKLLRAYVRALTSGSEATTQYFSAAPVWAGMSRIPQVVELMKADSQWWAENLAVDGLSPDRILVIRRAVEGFAIAVAYGDESDARASDVRELLLHLASDGEFNSRSKHS